LIKYFSCSVIADLEMGLKSSWHQFKDIIFLVRISLLPMNYCSCDWWVININNITVVIFIDSALFCIIMETELAFIRCTGANWWSLLLQLLLLQF
jgi:hypothetical protein